MSKKNLMMELLHQKLEYLQSKFDEYSNAEHNEEQLEVLWERRDELLAEMLRITIDSHFDELDMSYKDR